MEQTPKPKKPWYKKTWVIIIGVLVLLFILAGLFGPDNSKQTNSTNKSGAEKSQKEWTEVYVFKGNGMKQSPVFELFGGEARLRYSYKGAEGLGVGVFGVYVVNEGDDVMKSGGAPEIMTSAEKEESESYIHKSAGKYYLNVNAQGDWVVIVEEKK
ncbi:MAG TPA: hypothetical protein P5531_10645 [Bacteroidales bacterium]|nr:hypothetical protein [Bacteroidales bacterium]HSA43580.1 hypothetical protein [Bacteroidales bacterium]